MLLLCAQRCFQCTNEYVTYNRCHGLAASGTEGFSQVLAKCERVRPSCEADDQAAARFPSTRKPTTYGIQSPIR